MIRPNPSLPWPLDYDDGVLPIASDEGCKLKAYRNYPREPWTCGWGETEGVTPSTAWTQDYADQRFCDSLAERVAAVRDACTVEPTPNQLAALVRFAYNYGGWRTSTVLRLHNRGDFIGAANAFALVNKVKDEAGKLIPNAGLTARRAREAAQYLKPSEGSHPMPQAVAPQPGMTSSPTVQVSTVGVVAAALNSVGSQVDAIRGPLTTIREFATEWLGAAPDLLPWLLLGAVCAAVLWRRIQQRQQGRA